MTKQTVTATDLDLKIRTPHPANPVYMAWTNRDQHSTMFANVIPTEQYNLKNEEFWSAASTSLGITNPACVPHIGTRLVRNAQEEEEGRAGAARGRSRPFRAQSQRDRTTGKPID